jgi:hypothetical protein
VLIAYTILWASSNPLEGLKGQPPTTWTMEKVFDTQQACDQWMRAHPGKIQRVVDETGLVFFVRDPLLVCFPHTIDPRTK